MLEGLGCDVSSFHVDINEYIFFDNIFYRLAFVKDPLLKFSEGRLPPNRTETEGSREREMNFKGSP
jgi:hypothetical protein